MTTNIDKFYQIKQEIKSIENLIDDIVKKETEYNSKIELLNDSLKIVKLSKHYKIESRKKFILDIINQALMIVFDATYRIDIIAEEQSSNKFNIKYKLVLYKNDKDISSNNELYETSGGGVITVISFVLKILLGYINSQNKFYILDEVFSQISQEYRSGIAKLLRILSDKYGFTFLIISHEGLEQEDVDLVYRTDSVLDSDSFNKLKLTLEYEKPDLFKTKDYFELDVENFQAIKKLNMKIKGVTVIHGATDSGKSAIQRSIRSLITNSFNVNLYPRWRKTRSKLTTLIRLTKHTEESSRFVELEYKNKVIYRSHTGDEFVGKKLASSNIFEILENFGFAQIPKENLEKLTGDLKQQTQRIFVTTQFDKLYLSDDRTGLEKIFGIIFDSQLFNQLESAIKSDINQIEREMKLLFTQKQTLELSAMNKKLEGFTAFKSLLLDVNDLNMKIDNNIKALNSLKNKQEVLSEIISSIKQVNRIAEFTDKYYKYNVTSNELKLKQIKAEHYSNLIKLLQTQNNVKTLSEYQDKLELINKSIQSLNLRKDLKIQLIILTIIKNMNNINSQLNIGKIKMQINLNKINLIKDILSKLNTLKLIERFNEIQSNTNSKKLELLTESKETISKLILIEKFKEILNKQSNITDKISDLTKQESLLESKYQLKTCECCKGTGYTLLS